MTRRPALLRLRLAIATLGVAGVTLLSPALALGHSELDVPTPADGATVEGTPATIEGTFTEPLDPDASSLGLRDAAGSLLAEGGVDPADELRMAVDPVPELAPGTYEVEWQAVAVDGHIERDTWSFTVVAPATPEPTPTPEPSETAAPTNTPPPTETPSLTPAPTPAASPDPGDGTGDSSDVILPILLGLAIVAGVAVALVRRQSQASGG